MKQALIEFLGKVMTEDRRETMINIINDRTRYLTVVLEDIFQTQNASAVLRSCDCFGVQDVHIIENRNSFNINPKVVVGTTKWLDIYRYKEQENNTRKALKDLKKQGYRIVATSPHHNDINLEEYDLNLGKTALVFGTELTGISDIVKEEADDFLKIPMHGFAESLNISVAAAISLHHLTYKLRQSNINWQLAPEERDDLYIDWMKKSIKKSDLLIQEFEERYTNQK
ncbi:TrmH family RNA methyltransferase [Carboxylicivirga caseinilyticus]|uniref:TrmH family RNA methyltransferase n=1 Tax=Carboxylicivirga caseinilyticus TaxID=3417572 RepID=UPI003D351387|nr:RNA methyltransferase [Marinilabiliaceae bacterium A049]